jgi:hypothetical protein
VSAAAEANVIAINALQSSAPKEENGFLIIQIPTEME